MQKVRQERNVCFVLRMMKRREKGWTDGYIAVFNPGAVLFTPSLSLSLALSLFSLFSCSRSMRASSGIVQQAKLLSDSIRALRTLSKSPAWDDFLGLLFQTVVVSPNPSGATFDVAREMAAPSLIIKHERDADWLRFQR